MTTTTAPRTEAHNQPHQAVRASTVRVPTRALVGRGVDNIRVLSETRFLAMIHQLVEESLTRRAAEGAQQGAAEAAQQGTPSPTTSTAPAAPTSSTRAQLQENWAQLREAHNGKLDAIEGRLASLTGVFESIQGSLSKMDDRAPAKPAAPVEAPTPPTEEPAAETAPEKPLVERSRPAPRDLRRALQRGMIEGE